MSQLTASQWFSLKFGPTYPRPDIKIKKENENQFRCYPEHLGFYLFQKRKYEMHSFFLIFWRQELGRGILNISTPLNILTSS